MGIEGEGGMEEEGAKSGEGKDKRRRKSRQEAI